MKAEPPLNRRLGFKCLSEVEQNIVSFITSMRLHERV